MNFLKILYALWAYKVEGFLEKFAELWAKKITFEITVSQKMIKTFQCFITSKRVMFLFIASRPATLPYNDDVRWMLLVGCINCEILKVY